MYSRRGRSVFLLLSLFSAGCGSGVAPTASPAPVSTSPVNTSPVNTAPVTGGPVSTVSGPIQHIVIIMQENRSFDHMFNGFPGADTVQTGMNGSVAVPLTPTPLGNGPDVSHSHTSWWKQWNNGKMDGFGGSSMLPYTYIQRNEVQAYWDLAQKFTIGDRMFQSNTGPSFVAHQYMIAGQSGKCVREP